MQFAPRLAIEPTDDKDFTQLDDLPVNRDVLDFPSLQNRDHEDRTRVGVILVVDGTYG